MHVHLILLLLLLFCLKGQLIQLHSSTLTALMEEDFCQRNNVWRCFTWEILVSTVTGFLKKLHQDRYPNFFKKETILLNQTENKVAQTKLYIGQFGSVRSTVQGQT